MAFPCPTSFNHHLRNHAPPPIYNCTTTTTSLITLISSSKINFMRSFPLKHNSWSGRCHATSPQSEPPPEKHLTPFSGAFFFVCSIVAFNFDCEGIKLLLGKLLYTNSEMSLCLKIEFVRDDSFYLN